MTTATVPPEPRSAPASSSLPAGLALPPGCGWLQAPGKPGVALCMVPAQPAPPADPWWEKLLVSLPTVLLGVIAVTLTLRGHAYNKSKDERARAQSIDDDYLIRTVLSPQSVDVFLKYTNGLVASLPHAEQSTLASIDEYLNSNAANFYAYSVYFGHFSVVDAALNDALKKELSTCEDLITLYCGEVRDILLGDSADADIGRRREAVITQVADKADVMLGLIRSHLRNIGRQGFAGSRFRSAV